MTEPRQPNAQKRERLLAVLGELIATGGATPFLRVPVEPGTAAFPEPWAPTKPGIELVLRRLLWYAGLTRDVVVDDQRPPKPPISERRLQTNVGFVDVSAERARFTLGLIGEDDVAGTLAHEVGVLYAAMHRHTKTDPYRSAVPPLIAVDPDHDLERGAVATVYLGLGVLAANAAYQQYSGNGRFNGGWVPLATSRRPARCRCHRSRSCSRCRPCCVTSFRHRRVSPDRSVTRSASGSRRSPISALRYASSWASRPLKT